VETIPYSQFKQHIAEGKLDKLIIGPENINGRESLARRLRRFGRMISDG